MVCKHFLPFHRLPFHFVDCFSFSAETFKSDVAPFAELFFSCLCFWCHIQKKSLPGPTLRNFLPRFSFMNFWVLGFNISLFDPSQFNFVNCVRLRSNLIFLYVVIQFSQHHLLMRQSFPHFMFLAF